MTCWVSFLLGLGAGGLLMGGLVITIRAYIRAGRALPGQVRLDGPLVWPPKQNLHGKRS